VFRCETVSVEPRVPFEIQRKVRIPEDAMHSFQSGHNAVHWKLVIRAEPDSGPGFTRSFPVVVYPLQCRNGSPTTT
jgi:hypothetical protein